MPAVPAGAVRSAAHHVYVPLAYVVCTCCSLRPQSTPLAQEHGRELCTRLMDKALSALEVKEGEEPLAKQLKDRQDLGELMVKVGSEGLSGLSGHRALAG